MRDFELEKHFSKWEFTAKHHMTASDVESYSLIELLAMASPEDKEKFEQLWLGYTETWGAPAVREQIAKTYDTLNIENILCMAGAGEGIYATMRVLLDKDDHAIATVPNYQSIESVPEVICDISGVLLREENHWQLDIDDLIAAIRPNTKLIAINFPNNPTGALMKKADLDKLIDVCRQHNIYLFSDEVYRLIELNDDDRMPQIADIYERGISLNVLSKAYGLPGLRVGWLASQDLDFLQKVERYKHYLSICNSGPSEQLAVIALKNREQILERNRNLVRQNIVELEALFNDYPDLFEWQRPLGGCVGYAKYLGSDGVEIFCRSLVEDSGILLLPSSIYQSTLAPSPNSHFRIGFGRDKIFRKGLSALRLHIEKKYT